MIDMPNAEAAPRGAALFRPHVSRAIWRAAIIELARIGYSQMSMDAVARRAGVGKAALYRRWNGKEAMVIGLIAAIDLEIVRGQDRGSLTEDLESYVEEGLRLMRRPLASRILPDLYAEMSRDTALAEAIREAVYRRKQESIFELVGRSIARGELPTGIDVDLAFDIIVGTLYWRVMVSGRGAAACQAPHLAHALAAALKAIAAPPVNCTAAKARSEG